MYRYLLAVLVSVFLTVGSSYGAVKHLTESVAGTVSAVHEFTNGFETSLVKNVDGDTLVYYCGSLETDIATIGATETTLIIGDTQTLTGALVIPDTCTVRFERGGSIANAGFALTIPNVEAGDWQVFSGAGAVGGLVEARVTWFGAVGDGATDDKAAFKAAFASVIAGGRVVVPKRSSFYSYNNDSGLTDAVAITQAVVVQLDGTIKSTFGTNQANPPYIFNVTGDGFVLQGTGTLQGPGTFVVNESTAANVPGLLLLNADNVLVDGITFVDPPENAIYIPNRQNVRILDCKFTGGPLVADATSPQHYYIFANGGDHHIISRCKFYADSGGGACRNAILYASTVHATNLTITDNQFTSVHEHATYLAQVKDSTVSHNLVKYLQPATEQKGNAMKIGGQRNTIDGNQIYNAVTGGITVYAARNVVVSNNEIYNYGLIAIQIDNNVADTYGHSFNIVTGNQIYAMKPQTSGTLESGVTYNITTYVAGDDFTNVGAASNATGVSFTATGTTPTDWTNGSTLNGGTVYEGIEYNAAADCTADVLGGKITNNLIVGAGESASVASIQVLHNNASYSMVGFDISGNTIYNSKGYGMNLGRMTESRITNNLIKDPLMAAFRGIYFTTCTQLTVENNTIRDDQAVPVLLGGFYLNGAGNDYIEMINNRVYGFTGTNPLSLSDTYHTRGRGNRISETDPLRGTLTMNNVSELLTNNANIAYAGLTDGLTMVQLTPLNAAAATVMGSTKSLYVSAKVALTSFTVKTADAAAVAAVDAVFAYEIVQ
uniref:Putative pectate lyase n=1 Tax=viral metagenome TaxID=1070528 RepID=A0A6M3JVJ3_9ZZZZ